MSVKTIKEETRNERANMEVKNEGEQEVEREKQVIVTERMRKQRQ